VTHLDVHPGHVGPIGLSDAAESFAKHSQVHRQHAVPGRKGVHDGGFHAAGARRRQHIEVTLRLKEHFEPGRHISQKRRKLGATMVDHLARHRLEHMIGKWRRAGNTQVHRLPPLLKGGCAVAHAAMARDAFAGARSHDSEPIAPTQKGSLLWQTPGEAPGL